MFNICIIKPENYIHYKAFSELVELIYFSMIELGLKVQIRENYIEPSAQNIMIGIHLLDLGMRGQLPKNTIILNTEQIHSDKSEAVNRILEWAKYFKVWDYSLKNIEKFKLCGIESIGYLKIGFQKELVRIKKTNQLDVDVLFYGALNNRRGLVLERLKSTGLRVQILFGTYGEERDHWISRSKVVLNHHYYESQIFEVVRVFYLLTNSKAVVGEVGGNTTIESQYLNSIIPSKYDNLGVTCMNIAKNDKMREELEMRAYDIFSKNAQKYYTSEILDTINYKDNKIKP